MRSVRRCFGWGVALALLAACAKKEIPPSAPDLTYLPADAIIAGFVDAARLREAALYRDMDTQADTNQGKWQEAREFLSRLGIDSRKDLDSLMFAYRMVPQGEGEWVAILRGRFDTRKIEKRLQEPDARMSTEQLGKKTVYNLVRVPEVGDLSLVIVDATTLALGRSGALRKVLDTRGKSKPSLASNREIARLVAGVDAKTQIWAVMDGREVARLLRERMTQTPDGVPSPALKNLSSVKTARFSAAVTGDLDLALEIESYTEKTARNLADALRGILAFGKMGSDGADPDASKLMEAIRVDSHQSSTLVRLTLPGETLKRLQSRLGATPVTPPELLTPR